MSNLKKKKLGIIGGLGPMATVRFYEMLTNYTNATSDQEHIDIIIFSSSSIPDRTAFITGKSDESPLPAILEIVEKLNTLDVDYIVMPCITGHYFAEQIQNASNAVMLNILDETVLHLRTMEVQSARIIATDGTITSGILQKTLENAGIQPVLPTPSESMKVMDVIYSLKSGKRPEPENLKKQLNFSGQADVSLLACTELSLISTLIAKNLPNHIDCMEVLARKAVSLCSPT
ncbi:MAG: amino acid racemase [Oscillospiraceae bacterium]|nr:amino acid racemase [Oscillospiraceae bacterium]